MDDAQVRHDRIGRWGEAVEIEENSLAHLGAGGVERSVVRPIEDYFAVDGPVTVQFQQGLDVLQMIGKVAAAHVVEAVFIRVADRLDAAHTLVAQVSLRCFQERLACRPVTALVPEEAN